MGLPSVALPDNSDDLVLGLDGSVMAKSSKIVLDYDGASPQTIEAVGGALTLNGQSISTTGEADDIDFDNAASGLTGDNVQEVIDELAVANRIGIESDTISADVSVTGQITWHAKPDAVRLIGEELSITDTGTINNLSPNGFSDQNDLVYEGTAPGTLTGLLNRPVGTFVTIRNGSAYPLAISHESALSQEARRFFNPGRLWMFVLPGDQITYRYSGSRWRFFCGANGTGNMPFFSDFIGAAVLGTNSSGPASTISANTATSWSRFEQGALDMGTGSTSSGRCWVGTSGNANIVPTKGQTLVLGKISATLLPSAAENFRVQVGYSDFQVAGTFANGVCYELWHDGSAAVLNRVVANNGSIVPVVSTQMMVADTEITLGVYINDAWTRADYCYSINGVDLIWEASVSSGLPSTTDRIVHGGAGILKTAGSNSRVLRADYLGLRLDSAVRH